jgi:hypothetical protein
VQQKKRSLKNAPKRATRWDMGSAPIVRPRLQGRTAARANAAGKRRQED